MDLSYKSFHGSRKQGTCVLVIQSTPKVQHLRYTSAKVHSSAATFLPKIYDLCTKY